MQLNLQSKEYLKNQQKKIEQKLEEFMPMSYPVRLFEAMSYSTLEGGKRLRGILCVESCKTFNGSEETAFPMACAIEIIHAQSLIHDDLPCMDNDDFRRGKPSTHKQFGAAQAILAGDAMIPLAYEIFLKHTPSKVKPESKLRLLEEFSQTIGATGLVGGQFVDVETEGTLIDAETLTFIHANKTGALYRFSLRSGAILAGCSESQLALITSFAEAIGLAFQISDDILDITGSKEALGKTPGKDSASNKNTYPKIHGLEESKIELNKQRKKALHFLNENNINSQALFDITNFIADRI